jgi:hypothetical protein
VVDSRGGNGNLNKPYRAIVTRDGWKYASFQGVSWMLFNLSEDPYETATWPMTASIAPSAGS